MDDMIQYSLVHIKDYIHINVQLFVYFQMIDTRVSGLVSGAVSIARFNNDHRLGIMCFTKYMVGVNS